MAVVVLENTQRNNINLTIRDDHGKIQTVAIPGARKSPENGKLVYGRARAESDFIEMAMKKSRVVKSLFERGAVFIRSYSDTGPSDVKPIDYSDRNMAMLRGSGIDPASVGEGGGSDIDKEVSKMVSRRGGKSIPDGLKDESGSV